MLIPASDGDAVASSAALLLIGNDDDEKGLRKFLALYAVVVFVTNEETKDLCTLTLNIHSANEYVKKQQER